MCMIVDVNIAHRVLLSDNDVDFGHVHTSLFGNKKPRAKLVYGGKLADEYSRNGALRRIVLQLNSAGRARRIADDVVTEEALSVSESGSCRSNDAHIIALARLTDVRLLCSQDNDLHADFTNAQLLSKPRGKVYQNSSHRHLLMQHCR